MSPKPLYYKKANIVETSRVNIPSQQHTAACSCLKLRMSPTLQVIWSCEVGPQKKLSAAKWKQMTIPTHFQPPQHTADHIPLRIWNFGCSQCMRVRQATDSGQQSSGSEESASRAGFVYNVEPCIILAHNPNINVDYDCTSCTMFCQNASFTSQWNASGSCCSLYLKSPIQNHPRSSSPGLSKVRSACVSMSPLICGISTQALQTSESWPATYERRQRMKGVPGAKL